MNPSCADALLQALQRHAGLGDDDAAAGVDLLDRSHALHRQHDLACSGMVARTSPVMPPCVVTGTRAAMADPQELSRRLRCCAAASPRAAARRECRPCRCDSARSISLPVKNRGGVERRAEIVDDGRCTIAQPPPSSSAFWIARQTLSDVSGMSIWVMPYSDSASITALTMQTRLPAQPASPQPLVPSGLDLGRRGMVADGHRRNVFRARQRIIHERAGDRLAALVVADFFHQRLADALRHAAMQLARDDHRIDDGAEIVDGRCSFTICTTPVSGSISTSAT